MINKESIEEYAGLRNERCKEVFAMRDKLIKEKLTLLEAILSACLGELSRQWLLPLDKTQWTSHLLENWEICDLMERIYDVMDSPILKIGTQLFSFFCSGALSIPFDSMDALSYSRLPKREKESVTEGLLLVALWKEAK